ncbi:hypothetical protein L519_0482 [Bordetella bronchiseptica MBORD678]|nr:hypothetical protein L515_0601 [Bordetella bronchiseptica MBORD665]KDC87164.1 hypothetical protein L516_0529 [Bordetella bronchiseptica MBORD668]KDD94237.1 hypothetical protein L519_0482 [Bordetella bronchiseptica MBORD678]
MGAMIDVRNRIAHRPSPRHPVVIPTDSVKPRALQPFQNIDRFRTSVCKVPYGKQSVLFWRKLKAASATSSRGRDMRSRMMVTAGRTNQMIAGNTMWNPAYRQHVLQNMGKNWGPATGGSVNGK